MAKVLDWRRDIAEGLFWVVLSLLLSWLMMPHLPERVPVHFNWRWQPDGWGSKATVVWLVPVMLASVWAVLTVCLWLAGTEKGQLRLDEKGQQWLRWLRSWIGVLFVALHGSVLAVGLGWFSSPRPILMPALGLLFLAIGKVLPHLSRNWVAGVRLPWTVVDERVWTPVHRVAGRGFLMVGLGFLVAPLLPFWWDFVPFIGLVGLILALFGYAYWLYRRIGWSGF
jgi:uncharacterized membrane protein